MKNKPFFSIIIPTYNRADILGETIQSVLDQQFTDFEIIIIDDGSTDKTHFVVTEYMDRHPDQINYVFQDNSERAAARNRGIKSASGNFVVLLDSDDKMLPNHLNLLSHHIKLQPTCNFFSTQYSFLEEKETFRSSVSRLKQGYYDYKLFLRGNPLACNVCIRMDNPDLILFNENRNLAVMEDWIFFMENLQQDSLYLIAEISVLMRNHEGRSMQQNKLVIERRLSAYQFIKATIPLSASEGKILSSSTDYFCAVHSYLDDNKKQARSFLNSAIKQSGRTFKTVVLSFKLIAGRKVSQFLSRLFR
jgi:GalNAc5-diNAcBac-PP-undecaprenol beta-1,3-glucosyltransferase